MSQLCTDPATIRQTVRENLWPSRQSESKPASDEHKSLAAEKRRVPPQLHDSLNDLYDASPLSSPISPTPPDEIPMSEEEMQRIIWPDHEPILSPKIPESNGDAPVGSEKFLLRDVAHTKDKTRTFDDDKLLRDEKDEVFRFGSFKRGM